MFKYIFFDFDGTLVNTNDLIILALRETAKRFLSRDLAIDELNAILGKYLDDQMKYLSESNYKEMVSFYKEFYKARQDEMVVEFPGIREMLQDIKKLGCKTAIVSAKGRGGIEHGINLFKFGEYIDVIISAYDIENNKPHPEPALKALEALDADPDSTLMVGDSPYDIMCGINAGIRTVFVDWSIFPKESILSLKPDYHIKTPDELVKIISASIDK